MLYVASYMIIIPTILIISGLVMSFFVLVNIREVRNMSEGELVKKLEASKPLTLDFHDYIIVPVVNFWHDLFLPKTYREFEKLMSKFRLVILKVERKLLHLTNYIRGKREMKENEQNKKTPYWNEINDFKKDLKEE